MCPPFPLVDVRVPGNEKYVGKYPEHHFHRPQSFWLFEDETEVDTSEHIGDTFSISSFIVDAEIMTPCSVLVDLAAVSLGSYPAAPNSVWPDFGNLHRDLLQPRLPAKFWSQTADH